MNKISLDSLIEWKCIGQGQFGEVFKVKHQDLGIHVAVKKLKGNVSQRFKELQQEAEMLSHASSNFYVTRLFGVIDVPPCIIMELVENGSLETLMENVNVIWWPLKYRILHEVAIGMNWLHSLSLLHLDLKPKNVLLNDGLHIRIADFGLSEYTSTLANGQSNEGIGGTLEYMPPEAFQEGYKPCKSTDVYSYAILSAVVLRGQNPYPVHNSLLIKHHVHRGERPCLKSLKNISDVKNLDKVIELTEKCWQGDIHQRPSFRECCKHWEMIISGYKDTEIKNAVRAAQKIMDCTDSSGSTTDVPQMASSETANTEDMSAMIKEFEVTHISEQPSVKLESEPKTNTSRNYSRSPVQNLSEKNQQVHSGYRPPSNMAESGPVRNPPVQHNQYPRPPNPFYVRHPQESMKMPHYATYPAGTPWGPTGYYYPNPPYYPPYQSLPSNINVTGNVESVQVGDNNFMVSMGASYPRGAMPGTRPRPASRGPPTQAQGYNINISGNTTRLQIGDNNVMTVYGSHGQRDLHTNPQFNQTGHTNPPSAGQGAQPARSSQVSTQEKDAFPGGTQPAKEGTRLDNQPDQPPPVKAADPRPSLQGPDSTAPSAAHTEHASFREPIQDSEKL